MPGPLAEREQNEAARAMVLGRRYREGRARIRSGIKDMSAPNGITVKTLLTSVMLIRAGFSAGSAAPSGRMRSNPT